ncbi:MAG TPA: CoA transferase [Rhizomicrobium sp.]|jgi:crotonobetainyl-CoA:carnitine CoA-transferase CaiB-like acyl-CoA transferase
MVKVLEGVRVLEMGTFITGPAAAMFLADMGADVVKVEQPKTGDPFRAFEGGLYSPHFQTYNRNKRSLTIDTREKEDLRVFDALAADADVFIQNFRPGTAEKLSVGAERLQKLNPGLVYCGISGFGHDGPDCERPAYDTVAQAASGWLRLLINPENPRVVGPAIADAITGFYAAFGIMGALLERQKTGKGRRIDVSMLEAMCHFNLDDFTHFFSRGEVMGPYSRPSVSQSYVFECADGKWIALHMSSPPKFWQGLANAIARPALFEDPRFSDRPARIKHQNDLIALMTPIFKSQPRAEWCRRLEGEGVPYAPVYDSSEALQDRQAKHLQIEVEAEHPTMGTFRSVRFPVNFDGEHLSQITAPPTLGEHNDAIRSLAGQIWRSRSANAAE